MFVYTVSSQQIGLWMFFSNTGGKWSLPIVPTVRGRNTIRQRLHTYILLYMCIGYRRVYMCTSSVYSPSIVLATFSVVFALLRRFALKPNIRYTAPQRDGRECARERKRRRRGEKKIPTEIYVVFVQDCSLRRPVVV